MGVLAISNVCWRLFARPKSPSITFRSFVRNILQTEVVFEKGSEIRRFE